MEAAWTPIPPKQRFFVCFKKRRGGGSWKADIISVSLWRIPFDEAP